MTFLSLTKKLTAGLTTVALLSMAVLSASAVSVVGDLNADSTVDVNDATYLQKILADLETAPDDLEVVAEAYADGKIDIKDATAIQLYSAYLVEALPMNPKGQDETQPTESSSQEATEPSSDETESTQPSSSQEATEPSSDETESTQPTESSTQETTQSGTDEDGWNNGIYRPFSL